MSDYSTRRTQMVDSQVRPQDVTKFPILEAMLEVPRESYVPDSLREAAYISENLALGETRVVLEPRTFAKLLDALDIDPDEVVLDIGCGLGYSTAILARLADAVVAVEEDGAMAEEAQATLSSNGVDNAAVIEAVISDGAAKHGPYDVIILEGAAERVPDVILDQLKEGGRIGCIFAEGALGVARIGYKIDGEVTWRFAFNANAPVLKGFEHPKPFTL
ncbi:protein-L-isoaspartate O-methyltransferase family protein [Profundibacter sp.]